MNITIEGKPVFAHVIVELEPGETIVAESDAMSSMSAALDMKARLNGGFFGGLAKKFLGKESLFINYFSNSTNQRLTLHLTQPTPGDIEIKELHGDSYCLQQGAYIASEPGIKLGLRWAGFGSLIGGEGLFKLVVSGHGKVIFGAYGGIIEKEINGEYIVDSGHLVAYGPEMKLKPQLAGGIFSSLFGGEGFVTRVEGKGKIYMQTRNLAGLASWINRHLA
ncbi:TIGR00266 family protein [Mucilaginibacter sp. Bleaf8]|uniref:TIGR00266 family protein n=1 Tax=Mucilaginibacter sp. Bleaf8 TaxID=2834430 RepID=UPI001BCB4FB6|nr:TIGR00266 family protein [Mucilaginibacter sp. Bleaf8]MBS7567045.1 TIGR00266 family protein [Mucilaginibacter sp. Bleaf8]